MTHFPNFSMCFKTVPWRCLPLPCPSCLESEDVVHELCNPGNLEWTQDQQTCPVVREHDLPFTLLCVFSLLYFSQWVRVTWEHSHWMGFLKQISTNYTAEEPGFKLPTSAGSWKKQENSRITSISALLTMPKPLTVWTTINCGKFWKR